uniref:Amino acid transporter n=2 Tax=Mesocestoides corti TaxID=53468 RepID=A0A5K3ERW8_MESCO
MSLIIKRSDIDDETEIEVIESERPTRCKDKCFKVLRENLFMILILVGVAVGFGLGFGLRATTDSPIVQQWIELLGKIYINVLDLTILPLIASNLIIVIANLNPKEQGITSIITLVYIIGMNLLGSSIGTAASVIIQPGSGIAAETNTTTDEDPRLRSTTSDVFSDLVLNLFPDNIIGMCISQVKSRREYEPGSNGTKVIRVVGSTNSKNLIGILLVSIAFGLAARAVGSAGRPFLDFFESLCEVTIRLVRVFLLLTPGGVCFMIAGAVMGVSDIAGEFSKVGKFVLTVTAGIAVLFIMDLLIYFIIARRNPFKFLPHTIKAWFISFATTSPIVSLPEMLQGCDDYGIRPAISRFVCPIATAMKSDGPAVFISCACMFVAQMELSPVPATTVVVIWLLTSVSVLAIPHIPSASIIISITILNSAGVATKSTAYLYAIDWLLDRLRAGVATTTTMVGAAFMHEVSKRKTQKEDTGALNENEDFVSHTPQPLPKIAP